jgi:hypothetical protein
LRSSLDGNVADFPRGGEAVAAVIEAGNSALFFAR